MDRLPLEIHGIIISFLDTPELLTCRLVSPAWNELVEAHLARVTHITVNQNVLNHSPIPNVLVKNLSVKNFKCKSDKKKYFFAFINNRCPNVKIFSSTIEAVEITDLIKLPRELVYFETVFVKKDKGSLPAHFTSLVACDVQEFCTLCSRNDSNVQYSNICRIGGRIQNVHPRIKKFDVKQLHSLKWYDHEESETDPLEYLPDCPLLQIFRVNFSQTGGKKCPPFSYPNLQYLKCRALAENVGPFLESIRNSSQLRAIEVEDVKDGALFLEVTATLQHLEFLKINYISSEDKVIRVLLSDSLKYLFIRTSENSLDFYGQRHEKLQFLYLNCQSEVPFEFNLPSLQEFSLQMFRSKSEFLDTLISLRHSSNLKNFDLSFDQSSSFDAAAKIIDSIAHLHLLEEVRIQGKFLGWKKEAWVIDISQYSLLKRFTLDFSNSYLRPEIEIVINPLHFHQFDYNSKEYILRRKNLDYRPCVIYTPHLSTVFLPNRRDKFVHSNCVLENIYFAIEDMTIHLSKSTRWTSISLFRFYNLIRFMPKLKNVSVVTVDSFNVLYGDIRSLVNEVCKKPRLESFHMDLLVRIEMNREKIEKEIVIDVREMSLLEKLSVKLRWFRKERREVDFVLKLGDLYECLDFEVENSVTATLMNGKKLNVDLPNKSKISLVDPMNKLKSLNIQNWSLMKDINCLFDTCKSIESLHMNKADHIRSLIPVLAQLKHLNRISGHLSHTFLRMFLTRFKQPRVLNVHSSLRPTIEKIQEKNKTAHQLICYFN